MSCSARGCQISALCPVPVGPAIRRRATAANSPAAALPHAIANLAFVPQVCFDKIGGPAVLVACFHKPPKRRAQVCQQNADSTFAIAIAIPLVAAAVSIAWILRAPPQDKVAAGQIFSDPDTGVVFDSGGGTTPERDKKGELAYKAVSYTPFPVEEGAEGERLRVDVGPVGARQPRTFVFEKQLRQPSALVAVTLPRPLGVVLEEDARRKRVVVAGTVEGSRAARNERLAKFDRSQKAKAALAGDVLRACTCTTLVYPAKSLVFGLQPPTRSVVLYGADGERWEKVATALKRGLAADGPVTLVLERPLDAGS